MQDGTQTEAGGKPEGWMDEMRPVGEPHPQELKMRQDMRDQLGLQDGSEQPAGDTKADDDNEAPSTDKEAAEHWRKRYKDLDAETQKVLKYRGIIDALESNPNLVDVLRREILSPGQRSDDTVRDDGDEYFGSDEGDEPGTPAKTQAEIEAEDREIERARMEQKVRFDAYCKNLMEGGMPEHEVDKFVQFAMNPTQLTFDDMMAVYQGRTAENKDTGETSDEPQAGNIQLPPPTSATASGSSDRPGQAPQTPNRGGHRFMPDPNNL